MNTVKWLNKFKDLEFGINLPSSMEEIKEIETIINFNFPEELIQLYLFMNGQKSREYSEQHLCYLLPMNEIKETFITLDKKDFIPIIDYAFGCDYIGFIKNKEGIFFYEGSLLNGEYFAAYNSIEDFFEWAYK
jgi:cell wall assembly regulator SMI1